MGKCVPTLLMHVAPNLLVVPEASRLCKKKITFGRKLGFLRNFFLDNIRLLPFHVAFLEFQGSKSFISFFTVKLWGNFITVCKRFSGFFT